MIDHEPEGASLAGALHTVGILGIVATFACLLAAIANQSWTPVFYAGGLVMGSMLWLSVAQALTRLRSIEEAAKSAAQSARIVAGLLATPPVAKVPPPPDPAPATKH